MTALVVLIPVSIAMGAIGLGAFVWALHHGQFEDPDGNAWRVIETFEAEDPPRQHNDAASDHAEDEGAGRPGTDET